jgi:hypothetical protein
MCREDTSWRVLGIDWMLILKFILKEWVLECGLIWCDFWGQVAGRREHGNKRLFLCYGLFSMAEKPLVGQGLIIEALRSRSFRHIALGRTPPDEWSARRRDLYLTTHNIRKRQRAKPLAEFEPRTHNTSKRAAADPRLRLRGHWDRHSYGIWRHVCR